MTNLGLLLALAGLLGPNGYAQVDLTLCDMHEGWDADTSTNNIASDGRSALLDGLMNLQGRLPTANEALRNAESLLRRSDDAVFLGYCRVAQGRLLLEFGYISEAIASFNDAESIFERSSSEFGKTLAADAQAQLSASQGDYAKALRLARTALPIARSRGYSGLESSLLQSIGIAQYAAGDFDESIASLNESIRIRDWQSRTGRKWCAGAHGPTALRDSLLASETARFDPHSPRGHLLRGEYSEALAAYQQRRGLHPRIFFSHQDLIEMEVGTALSYEGLRKYAKAKRHFAKALNAIEDSRRRIPISERLYFLNARGTNFPRLAAAEGLARTSAALPGGAEDGFRYSEHTRARQFSEMLSLRSSTHSVGLSFEAMLAAESARNRLEELRLRLAIDFPEPTGESIRQIKEEISAKESEFQAVMARHSQSPRPESLTTTAPLRASQIGLADDEILLEYEVTEPYTLAFVVKSGRVIFHKRIPVTRSDLNELVAEYRNAFDSVTNSGDLDRFDPVLANRLYRLLLAPIFEERQGHDRAVPANSRLIIVPDEALSQIPFESLVTSISSETSRPTSIRGAAPVGLSYVADRFDIAYAQSATALALNRSRPNGPKPSMTALIVADPVFDSTDSRLRDTSYDRAIKSSARPTVAKMGVGGDRISEPDAKELGRPEDVRFPRLPQTNLMAQHLANEVFGRGRSTLLVGLEASERILKSRDLTAYSFIILATHGLEASGFESPSEPSLVFSLTEADSVEDGFLTLSEAAALSTHASIVALTACNTGVGRRVGGEGILALSRAFQVAGAKAVLATMWPVAEEASTALIESFFHRIKDGASPREALRDARIDIRRQGFEHPFYWSSTVLIGS